MVLVTPNDPTLIAVKVAKHVFSKHMPSLGTVEVMSKLDTI